MLFVPGWPVAQVVECLPSKHKALSSNPSPPGPQKRESCSFFPKPKRIPRELTGIS
jgi:hypothetical protein